MPIEPQSSTAISFIHSQLAGVLVGGLASGLGVVLLECIRAFSLRKSLKAALAAEIETIIYLLEQRKYEEWLEDQAAKYIEHIRTFESSLTFVTAHIVVSQNYTKIYEANLDKVGLLKKLAQPVCKFYCLVYSTMDTLETEREISRRNITVLDRNDKETFLNIAAMFRAIQTEGKALSAKLRS